MCWISKECKPLVSDGHVKVIKICGQKENSRLCGYFRASFCYILNFTYKTEVNIKYFANEYYGDIGFHCYSADKCAWKTDLKHRVIKIGTDIDTFSYFGVYPIDYADFSNVAIVEGYIPKGTVYYINEDGEIISNGIVLTKVLQTLKTK